MTRLRRPAGALAYSSRASSVARRRARVPAFQRLLQGEPVDAHHRSVQQAPAVQLPEDAVDPAGAVHVLHVVGRAGRHLAQAGDPARQPVDVRHGEVDPRLPGDGQQVQDRVGGAAHGDVQRHGVQEGRLRGDRARQHRGVAPRSTRPRPSRRCAAAACSNSFERGWRAWPPRCRCRAAPCPAPRSGSSWSWR